MSHDIELFWYFRQNDFSGYRAQLAYGMVTPSGEKYSYCAPMWVKSQVNHSEEGRLTATLELMGIPDMLAQDEATYDLELPATDNNTVEDILTALLTGGLINGVAPFYPAPNYTVVVDSCDSLINTFKPRRNFKIVVGDNRLAKIQELLQFTQCRIRWGGPETDLDNAVYPVHIFNPVISGSVYDYTYEI